jgi:hypothetical protein
MTTAEDVMNVMGFNWKNTKNECAGAHHVDARTAP